jgi:hypothetical protein
MFWYVQGLPVNVWACKPSCQSSRQDHTTGKMQSQQQVVLKTFEKGANILQGQFAMPMLDV